MTLSQRLGTFSRPKIARYVAEFIGTMFLILSIRLSVGAGSSLASLAIGTCLMCVIYAFGWISGGHFNPAVTLAVATRANVESFLGTDWLQIAMYWVAQLLGATVGGVLGNVVGGDDACLAGPKVADGFGQGQGFLAELLFTFLLTSVVLHTGTHQGGNQFYGLSIGFSLVVAINCIGQVTGCAINPSVWLGLNVAAAVCDSEDVNGDKAEFAEIWVFWVSQFLAACISGAMFKFLFDPACNDLRKLETAVTASTQLEMEPAHVTQESMGGGGRDSS